MSGEKKRVYRTYSGQRKDDKRGETVDHNVQVNDLPDVGQYVVVNDLRIMERAYGAMNVLTVYEYNNAYLDSYGNPIVYRVESYTKGQNNPLDPANKVMLVNHSSNGKLTRRVPIRTILIATGSMELEVVDPEELKEVGFRKYDGDKLISEEDMRVVEYTIGQGKVERVCRQNKHL